MRRGAAAFSLRSNGRRRRRLGPIMRPLPPVNVRRRRGRIHRGVLLAHVVVVRAVPVVLPMPPLDLLVDPSDIMAHSELAGLKGVSLSDHGLVAWVERGSPLSLHVRCPVASPIREVGSPFPHDREGKMGGDLADRNVVHREVGRGAADNASCLSAAGALRGERPRSEPPAAQKVLIA